MILWQWKLDSVNKTITYQGLGRSSSLPEAYGPSIHFKYVKMSHILWIKIIDTSPEIRTGYFLNILLRQPASWMKVF